MELCILTCLRKRLFPALVCLFTFCAFFYTSFELRADVLTVGQNIFGQLGDGTQTNRILPVRPAGLTGVVAASCGGRYSSVLKSDGTVWSWGNNDYGQLGDGTTTNRSAPVQVVGLTNIISIKAGFWHCFAIKSDGTLWAWGLNGSGQLGDGTDISRSTPVQVLGLTNVVDFAAGSNHSVALKSDGTVWTWGLGHFGQLGDGTTSRRNPVNIGLTDIVAISSKEYSCFALKSDGTVWAWGRNFIGQLGDGTRIDRFTPVQVQVLTSVAAIACTIDGTNAYALKSDGTVWSWGSYSHGALGRGNVDSVSVPHQISSLNGVVKIAAGSNNCFALKSDDTLWAWGRNNYGQLGFGEATNTDSPRQVFNAPDVDEIAAGEEHTLFLTNLPSGMLTLQGISPNALPQTISFLFHPTDNSGDIVRTADVPPVGDFVLPDVPANTYSVRIKGAKYLAKNVTVTTTGAVRNLTATLKTGDANNDNAADIGDLLLLIAHYNQTQSTGGYLDAADFNGDGANDIGDLLLLIGNYNTLGD